MAILRFWDPESWALSLLQKTYIMKAALALSLKHPQMKQEIWQPLRTQPELETLPYNSLGLVYYFVFSGG